MLKSEVSEPDSAYAGHPYRWVMLAATWQIYFCFGLATMQIAALVKPIAEELNLSNAAMGTILGAWPLVYIATAIPCGAVVDRIGTRRAIFIGALIMALSVGLRGLAPDYTTLFLAVALFGFGGPLLSIGAPKHIAYWFAGQERGLAMGIYMTGPFLGGISVLALTNSLFMPLMEGSWRSVLFAYAGVILICGTIWLIVNSRPVARAAEIMAAKQPRRPQLETFLHLVRLRPIQIVLMISLGIFFFNHALNGWLPEILRSRGMTAVEAGYWASLPPIIGLIGVLFIPRLATADRRWPVLFGLFGCAALATLFMEIGSGPVLAAGLVCQGIARSSMMTVMVMVLSETKGVDQQTLGLAGGMFFSCAEVGGVLGPLMVGVLADATGSFSGPLYMLSGVALTLMVLLTWLRRSEAS